MTNKQALREEFRNMQDHYSDPADRKRQEIYIAAEALLDELEAKDKRIAELEAREVKLPEDAEHDVMAPVVAYFLDKFKWDGSAVRWDGRREYDLLADKVKYALNMISRRARINGEG